VARRSDDDASDETDDSDQLGLILPEPESPTPEERSWLHPSHEYYPVFLEATFRGLWDPKDDLSGDLNLIDNTLSSSNVPVEKQNLNNKLSVWQHVGYQHANKVLEVLTIHYSGCIVALPGPEKSAFLPPRQLALITSLLFHVRFVMSRETI